MATDVAIRKATAADLDAIHAIELESFSDPWERAGFRDLILGGTAAVLVATDPRGAVLGFGISFGAADEAEIANVAVARAARRAGIGSALVSRLIADAESIGAKFVYLEVRESNAGARALYAAHGFSEVARRAKYYEKPVEDAVIMRRAAGAVS